MVLIAPDSTPVPDHADPASWRSSVAHGGSPGGSDTASFTGDPAADDDHDGICAYREFAQGTSDASSASRTTPRMVVEPIQVGQSTADHLVFEFQLNLAADEVQFIIESCPDLLSWADAAGDFVLLSTANNGDGTALARYRSVNPFELTALPRCFYRLAVSPRP